MEGRGVSVREVGYRVRLACSGDPSLSHAHSPSRSRIASLRGLKDAVRPIQNGRHGCRRSPAFKLAPDPRALSPDARRKGSSQATRYGGVYRWSRQAPPLSGVSIGEIHRELQQVAPTAAILCRPGDSTPNPCTTQGRTRDTIAGERPALEARATKPEGVEQGSLLVTPYRVSRGKRSLGTGYRSPVDTNRCPTRPEGCRI